MLNKTVVDNFISNTHGRFFRVTFVKRTTGETRRMVARTGVTRFLKGGAPAYDFKKNDLIPVWDVQKQAYRSIPTDSVVEITFAGETIS